MNRAEIERGDWVERYLAGRLSETEVRRFEAYWVENPDLIRDIEAAARLKSGLALLHERGELAGLMRASWWSGRMRLLVLAACAVLVVAGLATWRSAQSPQGVLLAAAANALPGLDGAALPRGAVVTVMRLRSTGPADARLELPPAPRALELRVLPEVVPDGAAAPAATPPREYELSLVEVDAAGAELGSAATSRVPADADGFVSVFVDSRTLRAARYRLRLVPLDGAGATGFLLDVRDARARAP
ncbi:MAG: hypothetical protein MUF07_15195 [Steroidobacteraceae bacterium]|jgi:hypothetical protein|nr:hypothetical protein [Steroidobacteraceae bacterium]